MTIERVTLAQARALDTLTDDERACLALLTGATHFLTITYDALAVDTFLKGNQNRAAGSYKRVVATCGQAGIDYDNLSQNEAHKSGPLPWGYWVAFPWLIRHTPKPRRKADPLREYSYLRLYMNRRVAQAKPTYILEGVETSREAYEELCKASETSAAKAAGNPDVSTHPTLTRVIRLDHIRAINGNEFVSQ